METLFLFIGENYIVFFLLLFFILLLFLHEKNQGGKKIDSNEVTRLINKEDGLLFDLRSSSEYSSGHIVGAYNVEPKQILEKINSLKTPKERPIILICRTGSSSSSAGKELKKVGFQSINVMSGGMMSWQSQGLPLSK